MPVEMTSRERVLTAARRKTPDRVPRTIPVETGVVKKLKTYFNTDDLGLALKDDHAWVGPQPSHLAQNLARYFSRQGVTWDEWGRGRIWDSEEHYAEYLYPLEHAQTIGEILRYPWPDLDEP